MVGTGPAQMGDEMIEGIVLRTSPAFAYNLTIGGPDFRETGMWVNPEFVH